VARGTDPSLVGKHDEEKLRRFAACRDAGDAAGARAWWEALVEDNYDRVTAMVAVWGRGGRLSADEQEDAVQRALWKVWLKLVGTFEGIHMGEWVNAVRACVNFACLDVQREAAERSRRTTSLDAPWPGEDPDAAPRNEWHAAEEAHRRAAEQDAAREFLAYALPQLDSRRRLVVERTLDGVPGEDIAAEIGVTKDNLYQLRSRGLKDLARLKERYDA
jgi:RNA polymerase sigma factor (sigma-70 family)